MPAAGIPLYVTADKPAPGASRSPFSVTLTATVTLSAMVCARDYFQALETGGLGVELWGSCPTDSWSLQMPAAGIPLYVTADEPAMSCADHRTPAGALAIGRRRRGRARCAETFHNRPRQER